MQTPTLTPPETWVRLMNDRGLRATEGRLTTLAHIETNQHCAASEIFEALSNEPSSLSLQSVHNIVNDLTAAGLLRRIDLPETGSSLYETRTGDNHHHVQCVMCHQVQDIECVTGEAPCLHPTDTRGMRLLEAAVVFRGVCTDCDTLETHVPTPTKGSDLV